MNINHNEDETSQAEKEPDAYVAYASKGPMVQKRSRANANATTAPYRKQNHNTDKNSASSSREKVEINKGNKMSHTLSHKTDVNATSEEQYNIGHFVDVASFLPELAQNNTSQTSSPKQQTEHKICGTNGKPGIPSLPDTSPAINNGTTLALPRVVIYKNPTTLWVSIPQVRRTIYKRIIFISIYF